MHRIRTHHVSDDGLTFEKVTRPDIDDIASGSTTPVFTSGGQIAGYWANGLTSEERRIINEECGVPYFYLGEPINQMTGKPASADTTFHVHEGQIFDLSNPKDVATVRCLFEVISSIGLTKQEAIDNGAMFYFFSKEEEKAEKQKVSKQRKGAAMLVDKLSNDQKQQIIKILALQGDVAVDPYIGKEAAVEVFDEVAFTMPVEVLEANNVESKENFICVKSLIHSGHIESSSIDGPFFKNASVYGQKTHLADSFSELMAKIDSHKDLIKAYREMESIVTGEPMINNPVRNSSIIELFSKHGLMEKEVTEDEKPKVDEYRAVEKSVRFMNLDQVLKALDSLGVDHDFDEQSSLKEAKDFYIKQLTLNA
jgi:tetrahydromethanopterin S-methyltransferase subunit A